MWMVGNWFRSDHSCLAMEQEYNQKTISCPHTIHPAWCAGGCSFKGAQSVCIVCLGSHWLVQLLWWLRVCFSHHVCCFAMRLNVIDVLYFLLQEWERCDWGPAFIFTCTISSCFWLLVFFFLHYTFATSFSHLPKLFYIFFADFTNIP
jgi:hypothetical protein